jgi:predicted TIM-barrel fold metal-dependent hydrolase
MVSTSLAARIASLCLLGSTVIAEDHRPYGDAHLHYVDFFQESEGIEALLEQMDKHGISDVVLTGLTVTKMWSVTEPQQPDFVFSDDARVYWYSLTDEIVARAVLAAPPDQRRRLHPFISGFNPGDKFAVNHVRRMLDWYPDFWAGIGEIITRHDDLTALTFGEPVAANHEALRPIYELAAERNLPVMIHSNITSVRAREPLYIAELEEALQQHPQTRFIWAHAGTSSSINERMSMKFLDDEVDRLLSTYDNLWIDLSWSVLDEYELTSNQANVRAHWLKIINRHPDRFLHGSDLVGKFSSIGEKMREFDPVLDELSTEDARRVAHDNLRSVLSGSERPVTE